MENTDTRVNIFKVERCGVIYYIYDRKELPMFLKVADCFRLEPNYERVRSMTLADAEHEIINLYEHGEIVYQIDISSDSTFQDELNSDKHTEWKNFLIDKRILQDNKLNVVKYEDGRIDPFFAASIFI